MKNIFIFAVVLSQMISCSKSTREEIHSVDLVKGDTLEDLVNRSRLDRYTPEGMGTLFSVDAPSSNSIEKTSLCNWFLIDAEHALTNSHCISEAIKIWPKSDCKNYMQGTFMSKGQQVTASCEKVIYYSELNNPLDSQDYALIKVKPHRPVHTDFLELSRKGLKDQQTIFIPTLSHYAYESGANIIIESTYQNHECKIQSSDLLAVTHNASSSPLAAFDQGSLGNNCQAIQGNSGSAVLNEDDQLVAILHAGLAQEYSDDKINYQSSESLVKSKLLSLPRNINPNLSIITNFRCAQFKHSELDRHYDHKTCTEELAVNQDPNHQLIARMSQRVMDEIDETLTDELPSYLQYKGVFKDRVIRQSPSSLAFYLRPYCLLPLNHWSGDEIRTVDNGQIDGSLPQFLINFDRQVDQYGNIDFDLLVSSWQPNNHPINFQIGDFDQLDQGKKASLRLDYHFSGSQDLPIGVCQEESL